jgi:hypothetical protein
MIENYHFGSITINGKTYNHDVEVRPSGEVLSWWRKESHIIDKEDVERAIKEKPEIIVIGTGESGVAQVLEEAKKEIESQGIELIINLTQPATQTFNKFLNEKRRVVGLFHLTC